MVYRLDIDGLRAVAVMSVVLYHAGIMAFQGGFIGVDIFLVISGYLITSILLRELKQGSFSFLHFYERRARRILPALYFVIVATIPFAWFMLLPKAFKEYGGSLISTIFFGSNIQFWLEDSYVAEASTLKPFLHTWTLSLEEQFYLFFPVLLLVCWKYWRQYINVILIVILISSLLMAQLGSKNYIDATFYLIHTRMWELLMGSLLAKLESDKGDRTTSPVLNKHMPFLGFLLIAASIALFNEKIPHPSFLTFVPILGTVMIIWFGGRGDYMSRLLSSRLFVFIGLISYSIYLWHQPIFAFARTSLSLKLSTEAIVSCISLTLALSIFSWWFIERPFRDRTKIGNSLLWKSLAFSSVILVVFGASSIMSDGFKWRLPKEFAITEKPQFLSTKVDNKQCWERANFPKDVCRFGNESTVLVGDSSLGSMLPSLTNYLKKSSLGFIDLTWGQCPYHQNINHRLKGCSEVNVKRDEFINGLQSKKIFIISYDLTQLKSSTTPEGEKVSFDAAASSVKKKIGELLAKGHKVVLLKQMPPINQNTVQLLRFAYSRHSAKLDFKQRLHGSGKPSEVSHLDKIFNELPKNENLIIIDPKASFCDFKQNFCWANEGLQAYFSDQFNHLTFFGTEIVVKEIKKEMRARWGIIF